MSRRSLVVLLPALLVLGLFGASAGTTFAQLPPVPTVSVPTVTVPSVPVPTVPTPPPAPTPPVPAPPPVPVPLPPPPPVPVPTPTVPKVEAPSTPVGPAPSVPLPPNPAVGGSAGSGSTPAPGAPPGSGGAYPPQGAPSTGASPGFVGGASSRQVTIVGRIRTSRPWLVARRGSTRAARTVRISFWLSRAGTVVFLVDELYPRCRYAGKFLVRARRGLNVVRFTGRVGRRQLRPGTYRLSAYPRAQRVRRLTGVTVVVLRNRAGSEELAAAQERNACPAGVSPSVRAALVARRNAGPPADRTTGSVAGVRATDRKREPEEGGGGGLGGVRSAVGGAAGSAAETIEAAADAVPPALFALAALAVLLLAIASMPQPVRTSRAGAALVHHRGTIAIAGGGVLVAAIISFALL